MHHIYEKKISLEVIGTIAPYVSQENVIKPVHKLIYHEQNQKFQCIWKQKHYAIKIKEGKILKKSHLKELRLTAYNSITPIKWKIWNRNILTSKVLCFLIELPCI